MALVACCWLLTASTAGSSPLRPATPSESQPAAENPLTLPKAIVLGVVEGVTEYLPVSSTGHLLITERLIGMGETERDRAAADTYTIAIQIGAIIAVLGLYRHRFALMIRGLTSADPDGRQLIVVLLGAFVPAGAIAFLFDDSIKEHLLAPTPVAVAWLVGGLAILWFVANQGLFPIRFTELTDLTARHALIIGCAQVLALWPGMSRSLVTILAGIALGYAVNVAVEFAFLLGFVTLSAASLYELIKNGDEVVRTFGIASPLLGTIVAGLAAFASVRFMVAWLNRRGLALFGWYRIVVAVAAFGLIAGGVL